MRFRVLIGLLALCAVGLIAVAMLPARAAAEQGCPAYSHAVYEANNVVHCKCNEPLISYKGRCQNKAAIEDQLQLRIVNALHVIKSTKEALEAERSTLLYGAARDHFNKITISIGAALLMREPKLLALETMNIAADLGDLLGKWGECESAPELRANCANLHNFERILHETANEL